MHFGCYMKRKKTQETEAWKLADYLERLTDEDKLDWTITTRGGQGQTFDVTIGDTRIYLTVGKPKAQPIILTANFVVASICWCHLMGLAAKAAMVVAAKEIAERNRRLAENDRAIGEIRKRLEER